MHSTALGFAGSTLALVVSLSACARDSNDTPEMQPPAPIASAVAEPAIVTTFCGEGWHALAADACVTVPPKLASPPTIVIFAHGILAPDALPTEDQATLLTASRAHGFAVLFTRGKAGLCTWDPQMVSSFCWPTKQEAVDEVAPSIIREWTDAQGRAEEFAGTRFDQRYLFGFSNGGYFVAYLSVEGRMPMNGAGVVGAGRTAVDETQLPANRLPIYLAVGDQEAAATQQDAANMAQVLSLRGWPLKYVVHAGRAHELHADDLTAAWTAWGR
jgi:predicted esterase